MFTKHYQLRWVSDRWNTLCKYLISIFFQFWTLPLWFIFYVISRSSSFLWQKKLKWFLLHCTSIWMSSKELKSYQRLIWQRMKGKFHHLQELELCKVECKTTLITLMKCIFNSRKCVVFLISFEIKVHAFFSFFVFFFCFFVVFFVSSFNKNYNYSLKI